MGEPATPPEAERRATRDLAAAIVESVRDDAEMPLGITWPQSDDHACPDGPISAVEELVFRLAQEITLLVGERERP